MAEKIVRKDWVSNFYLVGKPVITDFTFELDKQSEKSSYVYNSMRLGVDCGEKHGVVWVNMIGGYSPDNPYPIRKAGKKEDGSADFENYLTIAWEDRLDDELVEQVADMSLITVGIEKTSAGKVYKRKFVSEYDAIAYVQEYLTSNMVVVVRGNLQYSTYNDKTTVRKSVTSIVLVENEDPANFKAEFTQTILINKESATLTPDNVDKDKGVMFVNARVLDYLKEYNGVEVRGQFPYYITFEQIMPLDDKDKAKKVFDLMYKVKKGVTQITMEGEFVESGATVQATLDDLPEEIRDLVALGVYTEEEAIGKCSTNGSTERRMVLKKPFIKLVGEEKNPQLQKFEERYEEDDLVLDCMNKDASSESSDDDFGWLTDL